MKLYRTAIAVLGIVLLAACALSSTSATLYEFGNRSWIVVRDTVTASNPGEAAHGDITQLLTVAVRQPDGSYRIVSRLFLDDTGESNDRLNEVVAPEIRQAIVGDTRTPTLDLVEVLRTEGKRVSTLNPRRITISGGKVTFPESAIIVPPTERQGDGGMY